MNKKLRYIRICKNCDNTFETDQKYSKVCLVCNPYSRILAMPRHPKANKTQINKLKMKGG